MHKQKAVYLLVVMVVLVVSALMSSVTIAQSGTDNPLVTGIPEQSNLIINCSFGESEKEDCGIKHFFELANNIMRLLLWVAVTGAGILIFYKGTKLAINVFVKGGHQGARKEVHDALKATLWGLLFILSAYLIVRAGFDIIGYNLNEGDPFKYDESSLHDPVVARAPSPANPPPPTQPPTNPPPTSPPGTGQTPGPTDQNPTTPAETETGECIRKGGGKRGCTCIKCRDAKDTDIGFGGNANTKMHESLAKKLIQLKNGTRRWVVTEAWKPTARDGHSAECHYAGTCVDVDFNVSYNDNDIKTFIEKAKSVGLLAVFETQSTDTETRLKGIGIPEKNILQWREITGDHFSIYDCSLPHPSHRC